MTIQVSALTRLFTFACLLKPLVSPAQQFDPQTLKRLGISPEAAAYFSGTPRFLPGSTRVHLKVNGVDLGNVDVRFDEEGRLCFTPQLLRSSGLKVPDGYSADACNDYRRAYPDTDIRQLPNQSQVEIVTPLDARAPAEDTTRDHYASGGTAAIVNYSLSGTHSSSADSSYQYFRAFSETGLNIDDWIVRSRQDFYSQGGKTLFSQGNTYVQHALPRWRATLQAGQISPSSSLFSVGTLQGVQIFPESALRQTSASGVTFSGIATSQSRVEVRQLGTLILMTQVPPGPFTLADIPIVSANADLDVQVISLGGQRQQFVVPAASFGAVRNTTANGLSIALGRYQTYGSADSQAPWIVTASNGWALGTRSSFNAGGLFSMPYSALAATFDTTPFDELNGSIGVRSSLAKVQGAQLAGHQLAATLSVSPVDRLSVNLSATWQTSQYRDLAQTLQRSNRDLDLDSASRTYTASMSWFQQILGALSATYTSSRGTAVEGSRNRAMLSWSRGFGRTSVTLSAARDLSHSSHRRMPDQYFLTVSIPLGRSSLSVYGTRSGNSSSLGATYTDTITPQLGYSVSSSIASPGNATSSSASIYAVPRYARVNLSVNRDALQNLATSWEVQGAAVASGSGVTFSPYEVGDTFGIAKVGDLAGVEIQTPTGPVWTDMWGKAVIASLPAYSESSVEINTTSLPRNANLPNGIQSMKPARGSVQLVDFRLRQVQRYLLDAVGEADHRPLAERSPVLDGKGAFVTMVGRRGQIFLDDTYVTPLKVVPKDGQPCFLDFKPVAKPDPDKPYESASAVCRVTPPPAVAAR
ncbi:fimbria/pilus outer membrane usher protein [Burkholderia gladioli]|uniref:fimbria/pilus outer membrane usher protein n=1 Tax=Burkholderia gladioli TaxID=28095 RepID=UPI00163E4F2B|nr:fimbria/pilus outer membrane usher protein [Burkholderia gladioli]